MVKNILADGEKTKIACYYRQYGLLSNGLFFYYTNWRLYIDKLDKITPSQANIFFASNNRFKEDTYNDKLFETSVMNFDWLNEK